MSCEEPQPKKLKIKNEEHDDGCQDEEENASPAPSKDDNGNSYFELSAKRRVSVRSFKGITLIDIREVRTRAV
jgi:hypothetical protein